MFPSHVASSCSNIDVKALPFGNPQKVNLSLYYETLNPNCSNFIVQNLATVFDNDLISIINLRMVPWGNAYTNDSGKTIVCKHGPEECMLNTVEACAINVWNDNLVEPAFSFIISLNPRNKYYGFIYCIEFLAIEGRHKDWKHICAMGGGLWKFYNLCVQCLQRHCCAQCLQISFTWDPFSPGGKSGKENVEVQTPFAEAPDIKIERPVCIVCLRTVSNACKSPLPGTHSAQEASRAKRMSRFKHPSRKHLI
ncbi:hypothetical protein Patl1_31415 [Pistacia atlantica]|uniref:Uncharacterized protein n=1 Tax=Pistacia atlantica TaxID=434234 RepID=A0ACC1AQR0_9ROSI|nr:hypothetical protein Patl1_31415 [Pistacia atlantica]